MGVSLDNTFGKKFGNLTRPANGQDDRPKADLWINIGYYAEYPLEDGSTEMRFLSLPQGIALDTMEPVKLSGQNQTYINFLSARNDLLEQLVARGRLLEPGEEVVLAQGDNGLAIQLRRVKDAVAAPKSGQNPFAKKLELIPKAA